MKSDPHQTLNNLSRMVEKIKTTKVKRLLPIKSSSARITVK